MITPIVIPARNAANIFLFVVSFRTCFLASAQPPVRKICVLPPKAFVPCSNGIKNAFLTKLAACFVFPVLLLP